MRFTFLGTSHGYPEPGKQCSCTMLELSGRYYFVDMGMPVIPELINRGISVDAVKGVFLTHMHGDHADGLVAFADHLSWFYKTADPVIFLPKMEAASLIEQWVAMTGVKNTRQLHYEPVQPGVIFDDRFLKVTAVLTEHAAPSYAYLLEAEGKTVLFTGDLKNPNVDFPAAVLAQELDLMVCEGAHFHATDYLPVLEKCSVRQVAFHHYRGRYVPYILELAQHVAPLPVIMLNDGMEITL